MLKLFFYFLFFFCNQIFAQDSVVEVTADPGIPVVNEEFDLIFKIKLSNSSEEPTISFNPGGAEVLRKARGGVSVSTTIIGGRFTSVKEVTYIYKMVASRTGPLLIRDIRVNIDGKENKIRDVRIEIAREAIIPQEVFLMATPSRTQAYLGEGIDIRYYLYFRVNVVSNEVTEFPKLNNFIKRFHMVSEETERVEVNGTIYQRALRYSARLYPEKVGKLFIDPLKMKVQYSDSGGSGIGAFNFHARRYKTRDIQSPPVEIQILNIPTENMPKSFTGLVGEHSFKLSVPRTKFLNNEVLEAKLEVEGSGALENYDAPKIMSDAALEEFDVRSEIVELGKDSSIARKVFDYTYLTREKLNRDVRAFELSYFIPETGSFEVKVIEIPAIEVEQGGNQIEMGDKGKSLDGKKNIMMPKNEYKKEIQVEEIKYSLLAPVFNYDGSLSYEWINIYKWFSIILFVISLVIHIPYILKTRKRPSMALVAEVFRERGSYSSVYRFLNYFFKTDEERMIDIIEKSKLGQRAKKYFKDLVEDVEAREFNREFNKEHPQKVRKIKLTKKYFLEVVKKMDNT